MILYCVRHGESVYNAERRVQGQSNPALSDLGRRQSLATAEALARLPIEAVVASPLLRALETARPIAERLKLDVRTDERLMEIHAGIFQGLCFVELAERFPDEAALWRAQEPDFVIPSGESRRQLMHRAEQAFRDLFLGGQEHLAVVAHGGSISAAFKAVLGIPAERNPFNLYNASISRLEHTPRIRLLTLNETQHLEAVAEYPPHGVGDLWPIDEPADRQD